MVEGSMKKIRAQASVVSSSDPEVVYSLLKNSATFPFWSMIDEFEMVSPGRDDAYGVGSRRIFRTGRLAMFEEVVEIVPNRLVAYVLLSGFPMNEYRAETLLDPLEGGGTRITWRCSFHPKYWGSGWFWRLMMTSVFRRLVRSLARASESRERVEEFLAAGHGNATSKRTLADWTHARRPADHRKL
jgi:Polyketide cyclase / dehydrase and lipid transport